MIILCGEKDGNERKKTSFKLSDTFLDALREQERQLHHARFALANVPIYSSASKQLAFLQIACLELTRFLAAPIPHQIMYTPTMYTTDVKK